MNLKEAMEILEQQKDWLNWRNTEGITQAIDIILAELKKGEDIPKPYKWLEEEKFKIKQGEPYRDSSISLTQCAGWISEYIEKFIKNKEI